MANKFTKIYYRSCHIYGWRLKFYEYLHKYSDVKNSRYSVMQKSLRETHEHIETRCSKF